MSSRTVFSWLALAASVALLTACTGAGSSETTNPILSTAPSDDGVEQDSRFAKSSQRDFWIELLLEGVSEQSDHVPIEGIHGLEFVPQAGVSRVEVGDVVGEYVLIEGFEESAIDSTDRADQSELAMILNSVGEVVSPVRGELTQLDAGSFVIVSDGHDLVFQVNPLQALRFKSLPFTGSGTVETTVGQRTGRCVSLWLDGQEASLDNQGDLTLRCRLPENYETVGGLRASLSLRSETVPDAILVPNAYIGIDDLGYYVNLVAGNEVEKTYIDVGPTDGVVRVVTSDLPVGAELAVASG